MGISSKLWCARGDQFIEFEVTIGIPYQDGDLWKCDWAVGDLFPHPIQPSTNVDSLTSLVGALRSVAIFLKTRQAHGDRFYYGDCSEENRVEDIEVFFWPTSHTP